ncbi:hypothetical protein NBRC116493_10180 [Aurantivibrio infirmus]
MDILLAKEVIDCLPKNRTLYHYYKDAYAVSLLRRYLFRHGDQTLAHIRQSKYAKLLAKPIFAELLASLGKGLLSHRHLDAMWESECESYVLTLGTWGDNRSYEWEQVSRPGSNLVLQLNFSNKHDEAYRTKALGDFDEFQYRGHPVSSKRCTMAWARIDFDFASNEALIEEVQTDWLRSVGWLESLCQRAAHRKLSRFSYYDQLLYVDKVFAYLQEVSKHQKIWSEAMLNAAVNFIVDEIGIRNIYYHSFNTGAVLKQIKSRKPPKSLYTELPKRFCFDVVNEGPSFIRDNKKAKRRLKAMKQQQWFAMAV